MSSSKIIKLETAKEKTRNDENSIGYGPPLQCAEMDGGGAVPQAFIEFRPLQTDDGEWEFDACAYTREQALAEFDDLEERLERCSSDTCFIREVQWSEEKVEAFNAHRRAYTEMLYEAMNECEGFGA